MTIKKIIFLSIELKAENILYLYLYQEPISMQFESVMRTKLLIHMNKFYDELTSTS